ncbi:hypothetical protein NMY22_g14041 [Coprinellus aureogranulatus]|nr:hypothetical protein NMY22_g14041 [Coprinellus aureogranulatus]
MVGWKPRDPVLRDETMSLFIDRVTKAQEFGSKDVPLILQYDDCHADLRPWAWPSEGGIPVRPDALDRYRYTHYFKGPSCPCPFKEEHTSFHEAKIGLAQTVTQPASPQCLGQYVAVCAQQQCGYFGTSDSSDLSPSRQGGTDIELPSVIVNLERYFGHPKLILMEYKKREKPLAVVNPFIFLTGETENTIKETGLRQMHILRDDSNNGLRGTNQLLKREDPENYFLLQDMLKQLLLKGLPSDKFWDLFVQCTKCKYVMPRQYFPYYHPCVVQVVHRALGLPRITSPPQAMEEYIDILLNQDGVDLEPEYALPELPSSDDFRFPFSYDFPWSTLTLAGRQSLRAPPFVINQDDKSLKGEIIPSGSEAERRISFLVQSLTAVIPEPLPAYFMPTFTGLTPRTARGLCRQYGASSENFVKGTRTLVEEFAMFNGGIPFARDVKGASKTEDLPYDSMSRLHPVHIPLPDCLGPIWREYGQTREDVGEDGEGEVQACHLDAEFRLEPPTNPILGNRKSNNQNHAIIFYRGEYLQLIDAYQDDYLEECLKICDVFAEFEEYSVSSQSPYAQWGHRDFRQAPVAIVCGHTLGDYPYPWTFSRRKGTDHGTLSARSMACSGGKLHCVHPDVLDALYMTSRGGVSKAQKGLHLYEDVYAGMNAFGCGGRIEHTEYHQLGKGIDLGFETISNFQTKIGTELVELGMWKAILRLEKPFGSLSPLFEVFSTQIYARSILSNLTFGGARYTATGRGFASTKIYFDILLSHFAGPSIYLGIRTLPILLYVTLTFWTSYLIYFWISILRCASRRSCSTRINSCSSTSVSTTGSSCVGSAVATRSHIRTRGLATAVSLPP